jgi:hypothetical protein
VGAVGQEADESKTLRDQPGDRRHGARASQRESLVVQNKALEAAIASDAGPHEIDTGAMVARNILDRRLGKPVERVMTASKVVVTFEGLRPDVFPTEPREAQAEIVEIPGDTGTEVDDDEDD